MKNKKNIIINMQNIYNKNYYKIKYFLMFI